MFKYYHPGLSFVISSYLRFRFLRLRFCLLIGDFTHSLGLHEPSLQILSSTCQLRLIFHILLLPSVPDECKLWTIFGYRTSTAYIPIYLVTASFLGNRCSATFISHCKPIRKENICCDIPYKRVPSPSFLHTQYPKPQTLVWPPSSNSFLRIRL